MCCSYRWIHSEVWLGLRFTYLGGTVAGGAERGASSTGCTSCDASCSLCINVPVQPVAQKQALKEKRKLSPRLRDPHESSSLRVLLGMECACSQRREMAATIFGAEQDAEDARCAQDADGERGFLARGGPLAHHGRRGRQSELSEQPR